MTAGDAKGVGNDGTFNRVVEVMSVAVLLVVSASVICRATPERTICFSSLWEKVTDAHRAMASIGPTMLPTTAANLPARKGEAENHVATQSWSCLFPCALEHCLMMSQCQ